MEKSNFKIIAVKALDECSSGFTKILKKEEIYYFYSDYKIDVNEDGLETISNANDKGYPNNLFNIKGFKDEININVSAIVGKNGSGKSSLIELLFRAINNIACNYKWHPGSFLKTIMADLKIVDGLHVELYYQTDKIYKIIVNNERFKVFSFKPNGVINEHSEEKNFRLTKLFYTEAVNYSHYAYNSLEFGYYKQDIFIDWLKELFHKNDSYQTPLVLNPMRTEGNFDINRENNLVKQRLLANLLRPRIKNNIDFRKFGDNLIASEIEFKLGTKKKEVSYWEKDSKGNDIERFYKLGVFTKNERNDIVKLLMFEIVDVPNFNIELFSQKRYNHAEMYILYKLISICKKYADYRDFLLPKHQKFDPSIFKFFIDKLKKDTSHITFKLIQVLNYLKNDYINFEGDVKAIPIDDLSKSIKKNRKRDQSILELIPPPIFEMEIKLISKKENTPIKFRSLSSGEKQQIYMVSSLLYHLYNLDSVYGPKIKYKNVNIVLEEVELYFHPEMQKSFIKYFLDSISRIELKNIKSINICFVTHSPFILSDIPHNNILFLDVVNGKAIQKKNNRKTFGANIHELLIDNFFMSNGFIGNFAKSKIEETIQWLNNTLNEKRIYEKESKSLTSYQLNEDELKYHRGIISLIDEPIVRIKLGEMLSEIESNEKNFYNKLIQEQIDFLKSKIR